jgi:hypothetical protein
MDILLKINPGKFVRGQVLERRSGSSDQLGGKMNRKERKSLKDLHLQKELRLTDEDIEKMRDLEATWSTETEEFIPSTLPLVELIRLTIVNSIGLTNPSQNC